MGFVQVEFPNVSWGTLGQVTCLDQSHASENILMDYNGS